VEQRGPLFYTHSRLDPCSFLPVLGEVLVTSIQALKREEKRCGHAFATEIKTEEPVRRMCCRLV